MENQKHPFLLKCYKQIIEIILFVILFFLFLLLLCDIVILPHKLRYNYKIGDVFRELMGCTSSGGVIGTEFSQSNRNKGRCTIL